MTKKEKALVEKSKKMANDLLIEAIKEIPKTENIQLEVVKYAQIVGMGVNAAILDIVTQTALLIAQANVKNKQ